MKLSQNEATRIVNIIDARIKRALGRGTVLEHTYGDVHSVQTSAHTCSVYIGGDTNESAGFRIPTGMRLVTGDRVRVCIDPRGDRWVEEVIGSATYPPMLFDPVRGYVYMGDGTSDPTLTIYSDGPALGGINTDKPSYFADTMQVDADLEAYSLTVDNAFILTKYPGFYSPCEQSSGSLNNGNSYTLSFGTEPAGTRDGFGMHFSFDPTKFYIQPTPGGGLYEVEVCVDWGTVSASDGPAHIAAYKNGSDLAFDETYIKGLYQWRQTARWTVDLAANDYLTFAITNETGVTRTATVKWVAIKKVSD